MFILLWKAVLKIHDLVIQAWQLQPGLIYPSQLKTNISGVKGIKI